jgi:hypothetical protein
VKRGYSRDFPVLRGEGKRFTLTDIPAGFWTRVRAKARAERVSMRALILGLLKTWIDEPAALTADEQARRGGAQ